MLRIIGRYVQAFLQILLFPNAWRWETLVKLRKRSEQRVWFGIKTVMMVKMTRNILLDAIEFQKGILSGFVHAWRSYFPQHTVMSPSSRIKQRKRFIFSSSKHWEVYCKSIIHNTYLFRVAVLLFHLWEKRLLTNLKKRECVCVSFIFLKQQENTPHMQCFPLYCKSLRPFICQESSNIM